MNKQRGYTLPELLMVVAGIVWVAMVCGLIYVAVLVVQALLKYIGA